MTFVEKGFFFIVGFVLSVMIVSMFAAENVGTSTNLTPQPVYIADQFPDEGNMVDPCGLEVVECEEEKPVTIEGYIRQEARKAGIDPQLALDIAKCESNFMPYARNPFSTAKGVYQFTDPTWKWIGANGHQYDQYENIDQFIKWFPVYPSWWAECLETL